MTGDDRRGLYTGWVVVVGCFLGSFVVFGLSYSFGVLADAILAEFGRSRGLTSVAFGVQTVMLYVGGAGVGVLVDRYGTRRMLVLGGAVLCTGLVATSLVGSLLAFVFTYGVLTGVGLSVVYVVSYATVPRWFDRRLGLAGGLASAGLGVGMLVVAPATDALIVRVGWRSTMLVLAGGTALALVGATALIRGRPDPGEVPAGEVDGGFGEEGTLTLREGLSDVLRVARSPSFLALFLGWVLVYSTLYVVLSHLVLHVVDLGISRAVGAAALGALGGASAVGRVVIGHAADRVGRARTFATCSAVMGVATLSLIGAGSAAAILGFAAVYGLAYGGNGALLAPLTADLFGRVNIGAVFGLVSGAFAVSGLLAPYLAGVTHDTLGTYDPVFGVVGVAAVVGAGAIIGAARLQ
ncbi:MFS transporter [Natronorarus salvus]|uniref:MFS transporter n=1 Tax=Natronorarus salvus TaxID=3117733 RepID=UPI002F26BF13